MLKGRAVLSFVNLLVESRGFPDRTGQKKTETTSQSRFPLPTIMAPVPFDCSSLSSFRVRISVNNDSKSSALESSSLAIQISGGTPIPPFVFYRILANLSASGRSFSAIAETWHRKAQGDHLNSSLKNCPVEILNEESLSDLSRILDTNADPRTLTNTAFSGGYFSLPAN